ncbi:sulfite exporter TauE/SafE family protein [Hyphobacterium sp. HN65]|uniref:Probable membrane transporter protein n=1 Tax=Hyphobacterium lacteum TaxID=3116575 RepID=A0ABU7LNB1_9PROT|nr:sulfite exporter TauE/SafE family protein [Hyphobacterium sp. HN65]MEE2525408.1 sulfite exporter TauE/SafE family protein [Hyphobacterium sp. HN65]
MQIYLPIAEISVNIFILLGLGTGIGFLSGMFGVGGGFLMTPLLIFIGVPPAVAVSTEANQIVASSASGAIAHWRRRTLDIKMGVLLLIGGSAGSIAGVQLFAFLRSLGQIDLIISLCYVGFLGIIGGLMAIESVGAIIKRNRSAHSAQPVSKRRKRRMIDRLPFKTRFPASGLYLSVIPPVVIGFFVGTLAAIMGVGGGFIMVPAMIYVLRMPTNVVVGTSLFQILFVTALTTFLQATQNQTVDIVLALLLIVGGVVGAQIGARVGRHVKAEELRIALALMVLVVCAKLGWDLVATPSDLFAILPAREGGH